MKETPLKPREIAAGLIAEGRYDLAEIAKRVGVTRKGLFKWRKQPAFAARVSELRAEDLTPIPSGASLWIAVSAATRRGHRWYPPLRRKSRFCLP